MKPFFSTALAGAALGLLAAGPAAAQAPAALDSLRQRLATAPPDTNRVLLLDELCWQFSGTDVPQATAYGRQGLALARRLGYRRGLLKCLTDLGNCAAYAADFPAGTRYFLEAVRLARQPPARLQIVGFAYNGLANLHISQKEFAPAQRYLEQALALSRQTHSAPDRALFGGSLGNVLRLREQYPAAEAQLRRALALYDSLGNPLGRAHCLTNLAVLCADTRRWAAARRHGQQALAVSRALHHDYFLGTTLNTLALVELATGHLAPAEAYARQSLACARRAGNLEIVADNYQALARIGALRGAYGAAYGWQQRYQHTHDSLVSEDKNAAVAALRVRFGTQQQEARIRALTQRTQALALRAERQRSRLLALLLAAVVLGLGGGGLLLYLSQRRRLARVQREARLRTGIAADLHDEVGTILTRISLQAEALRGAAPAARPALLERLLANSRAAARTMRDIVWGIDAAADTAGSLLDRMRDHLDQTAAPAGLLTELRATGLPDAEALPPELRQHLYLIFKEATTNALRHAPGATCLRVALSRRAGQLELVVENDGRPAAPAARSGMGLRNMRQRAAALRGHLEAGPLPEGGFRVRLVVPG